MPPRRKPISTKQKKESQKLKRAIKRGDVPPPDPSTTKRQKHRYPGSKPKDEAAIRSERLESSFVKLSPQFLEETKHLASTLPLPRPLAADISVLNLDIPSGLPPLTCPRRPKWRYDSPTKMVLANEEAAFKKWLTETDEHIMQWRSSDPFQSNKEPVEGDNVVAPKPAMPRSTSYFERNLEVWRQLWRVTEISDILLVLVDSRCPMLHYPPSLAQYLSDNRKRVILVLTKVDIAGPERADAWTRYLRKTYPTLRVIQVEAYAEKPEGWSTQGTKKKYEPHLPRTFRESLVSTIREIHEELLEPPEAVKKREERLKEWKPPVKEQLDWEAVLEAKGDKVGMAVGGAVAPLAETGEGDQPGEETEPPFLTVGLIGQPNVGKSSLLNAIFGTSKVRASRTPGKTKHFQTLFWTSELRLVDCPGLVMPNYIPMETQVLAGILPIARVSAVPACIYHACTLLPLEKVLKLSHPSENEVVEMDKRTWRDEAQTQRMQTKPDIFWKAMDVLTAYALQKGWVTAKAGRPDVNRAGNAILRALAESRIRWAFWPPGSGDTQTSSQCGVWIEGNWEDESGDEDAESGEEGAEQAKAPSESEEGEEEESEESEEEVIVASGSRFDVLAE